MLTIEVIYALPEKTFQRLLKMPVGTTVIAAVKQSGLIAECGLTEPLNLGIFGNVVAEEDRLTVDTRVEIYRPLTITPIEARKLRTARKPSSL